MPPHAPRHQALHVARGRSHTHMQQIIAACARRACAGTMATAQRTFQEICDGSLQRDLLRCRRSLNYIAGQVQDTRRHSVTVELLDLGKDPENRRTICTKLLAK